MGERKTDITEYLTTAETAEILGLSAAVLGRKAKRGQLGAIRKGYVWLFLKHEVERYKRAVEGKALNDPTRGREL